LLLFSPLIVYNPVCTPNSGRSRYTWL